jgi:hypothetical protein
MGRALQIIFKDNTISDILEVLETPDFITKLGDLEMQLNKWFTNVPNLLKVFHSTARVSFDSSKKHLVRNVSESIVNRQATILSLRYYHCDILLHRPYVIGELRRSSMLTHSHDEGRSIVGKATSHASVVACIQSSWAIIGIIHRRRHHPTTLGAWWYTLYYGRNKSIFVTTH